MNLPHDSDDFSSLILNRSSSFLGSLSLALRFMYTCPIERSDFIGACVSLQTTNADFALDAKSDVFYFRFRSNTAAFWCSFFGVERDISICKQCRVHSTARESGGCLYNDLEWHPLAAADQLRRLASIAQAPAGLWFEQHAEAILHAHVMDPWLPQALTDHGAGQTVWLFSRLIHFLSTANRAIAIA